MFTLQSIPLISMSWHHHPQQGCGLPNISMPCVGFLTTVTHVIMTRSHSVGYPLITMSLKIRTFAPLVRGCGVSKTHELPKSFCQAISETLGWVPLIWPPHTDHPITRTKIDVPPILHTHVDELVTIFHHQAIIGKWNMVLPITTCHINGLQYANTIFLLLE